MLEEEGPNSVYLRQCDALCSSHGDPRNQGVVIDELVVIIPLCQGGCQRLLNPLQSVPEIGSPDGFWQPFDSSILR